MITSYLYHGEISVGVKKDKEALYVLMVVCKKVRYNITCVKRKKAYIHVYLYMHK